MAVLRGILTSSGEGGGQRNNSDAEPINVCRKANKKGVSKIFRVPNVHTGIFFGKFLLCTVILFGSQL